MVDAPAAAPPTDFPDQVEAAAKAFAALVRKLKPDTVAKVNAALGALTGELIEAVSLDEAQTLKKILGGFLGGLAAPGIEKSTDALIGQIGADATGAGG